MGSSFSTKGGRCIATHITRLKAIPDALPAQIGCLGRCLVELLNPWRDCGRAVAIDSTPLRASGGVWHQKQRAEGKVPQSAIDTEAHWTKSGGHGWVDGWKQHLASAVAAVSIPLAAKLTPANVADNVQAPALLDELPEEARFVLGDTPDNDPALHERGERESRILVTTKRGKYPPTDEGVEVRRIFHELRSRPIENVNGQFKDIFDCLGQVPTRGLVPTRRFVLGAVFVHQLTLLPRFLTDSDRRIGRKPFLKEA